MELSEFLKITGDLPRQRQIYLLILRLGIPAILAYMASVAMQYIDTAMVGSLGATAPAAVGVVISSTWVAGGIIYSSAMGFSVQVAHAIGADDSKQAKKVFCEGLVTCLALSCVLSVVCMELSSYLPRILVAEQILWHDVPLENLHQDPENKPHSNSIFVSPSPNDKFGCCDAFDIPVC